MEGFAQKGDNVGFFINVTMELALLGLVGDHKGAFSVSWEQSFHRSTGHRHQDPRNDKTAA